MLPGGIVTVTLSYDITNGHAIRQLRNAMPAFSLDAPIEVRDLERPMNFFRRPFDK